MGRLIGLPDAAAQREADRWAIEDRGIAALELMERAGAGLAAVVGAVAPAGRAVIVCGKGNNGGDGLVAARLLREAGREADVLLTSGREELSPDARAELDRLWGPPPEAFTPARLEGAAVIVDALLGTGFSGAPRAPLDGVIEAINATGAPVVAADVPSGVNASTGEVEGAAVRAAATATFHAAKPGLWIHPGKGCAGAVHVVDIGIPPGAPGEPEIGLIADGMLAGLPSRAAASTKFSSGAVVVVGGSPGITGAPVMAAAAAMRAGAGYVTIATGDSGQADFARRPLEVMLRSVPDEDGFLGPASVDAVLEATARAGAVVLGPGLGRAEPVRTFVAEVARRIEAPLVIDADGLNALGGEVPRRDAPTVLTPHEGELGRLLDVEPAAIAAHRLEHARTAARHATVVLKGDDTLVAFPDGRVAVSPGGAPGLATAGTGDVLSGVVGALLARGADPDQAVCAAVLAHVRAGRLAAEPHGPDGVIATDVIAHLPAALSGQ